MIKQVLCHFHYKKIMSVVWNEIPNSKEFLFCINLRHTMKETNYTHELLPKNSLIKDLWNIVFDYFDYEKPMEISIPFSALATKSQYADDEYLLQKHRRPWFITHLCGREDQQPFTLRFSITDLSLTFTGYFPIRFSDVVHDDISCTMDPNTRVIIRVCFDDPAKEPNFPKYWIQSENNFMKELTFEEVKKCVWQYMIDVINDNVSHPHFYLVWDGYIRHHFSDIVIYYNDLGELNEHRAIRLLKHFDDAHEDRILRSEYLSRVQKGDGEGWL